MQWHDRNNRVKGINHSFWSVWVLFPYTSCKQMSYHSDRLTAYYCR